MRKAKVCISCAYSTAVPLQTQTTPPAASQKPGQQHHCVSPHTASTQLTNTEADNSRMRPPGVKLLILLPCPQGAAIDTACGLSTCKNQFSQKLDIINSALQLTEKSAAQVLLYNRILKTPSKTTGVQTR